MSSKRHDDYTQKRATTMANPLRRISQDVEDSVGAIANREDRTFIAQLDRVVAAGLHALKEPVPTDLATSLPTGSKPRKPAAARK